MLGVIKSDVGRVRANNEDSFYFPPKDSKLPELFIVADGMGGHQAGEVASKIATNEVAEYINSHLSENISCEEIKETIKNAVSIANEKILHLSLQKDEFFGMGTTLTAALFYGNYVYIGHVGDSRAYLIRENDIKQLTRDHSLVWQLVESGRITMEEARVHPMKNIITKALGTEKDLEPDILKIALKDNDIILLCSDGLTNMLENDEIKDIVLSAKEPEKAVQKLIDYANFKGGEDNITVGIIKVDEVGCE